MPSAGSECTRVRFVRKVCVRLPCRRRRTTDVRTSERVETLMAAARSAAGSTAETSRSPAGLDRGRRQFGVHTRPALRTWCGGVVFGGGVSGSGHSGMGGRRRQHTLREFGPTRPADLRRCCPSPSVRACPPREGIQHHAFSRLSVPRWRSRLAADPCTNLTERRPPRSYLALTTVLSTPPHTAVFWSVRTLFVQCPSY